MEKTYAYGYPQPQGAAPSALTPPQDEKPYLYGYQQPQGTAPSALTPPQGEKPYLYGYPQPQGTVPSALTPPQGEKPYLYGYPQPQGTAPSALTPPQGEKPYLYGYPQPQGMAPSALTPPQGGGSTGVIVNPRFCSPYLVDMAIVRKMMKLTDGNFVVTDVTGTLLFKVKDPVFASLHDKRIMLDGSGSPVVTMRQKMASMHHRWQVFRGGSTEPRDLLYTVKRSSMVQIKAKLDVFMSHNIEENICDFRVIGSWLERSCIVYAGESNTIVAQMHKKHTAQSVFLGKDNFSVTVYPNVDFAFIASLVVILDDVN